MISTIRKIGNSSGAIFPASFLKKLNINDGDSINIFEDGERIVIERINQRPKYSLDDLISQCDANASSSIDLQDWENMEATGSEEL